MSSLWNVHQISSDEDEEEELDLAVRVRRKFQNKAEITSHTSCAQPSQPHGSKKNTSQPSQYSLSQQPKASTSQISYSEQPKSSSSQPPHSQYSLSQQTKSSTSYSSYRQLFQPQRPITSNKIIEDIREFAASNYNIHEISDDEDEDLPDIQDITVLPKKDLDSSGTEDKIKPDSIFKNTIFSEISSGSSSSNFAPKTKEAKMLEKEMKKKEREKKREEKENLKRKKGEEKLLKRAFRPGECLKYLSVQIDRNLLEAPEGSEIISKLLAVDIQYKAVEQLIQNTITYSRRDPISGEEKDEKQVIIIMKVDNFLNQVYNQIYGIGDFVGNTLVSNCTGWKGVFPGSRITIVLCGVEEFFNKQRGNIRKNYRERLSKENEGTTQARRPKKRKAEDKSPSHLSQISRIDIEMALLSVQMELDVNSRFFENPSKIADFVAQVAKAVAEKPFKLKKESNDFSWHAESYNVNCVKVDKSGVGLLKLWHQQLQQFNNVGPEAAQAIAKKYSSPQSLVKAYENLSEAEGKKLLADIPVRRGVGVLANTRRIGPELSNKIYSFFMCEDPEVFV